MNQEFPKPLQNALAGQAGGEAHPSPDVLTSFMERTLPLAERDLVTNHLARCADCREVVFLASSAAEEVMVDERELVATAAHQPVLAPGYGHAHVQPAALAEPTRRWWIPRLSWAVAAVAVLLVASVLVWQRFSSVSPANQSVSTVASNRQPPSVEQPAASEMPAAPETLERSTRAKTTPPKTVSPQAPGAVVGGALARKDGEEFPSASRAAAAPADESAQTPASVAGAPKVVAPVPATHNAFVESQADSLSQLSQGAALANPILSARAFNATRGQWRISADGHLERRVAADDWIRVLANEPTTFRVVSVVGADVWAGGDGGTLFHSTDRGQHWSQVPLVSSAGSETGTIVSIQFDTLQHGTVLAVGGSRWTTSDGGVTWTAR